LRPFRQSIRRIGEPDCAIGFHHDIIRRVELLAFERIDEHRDRSIFLGSRHAPRGVLATNQPAFTVERVAIGTMRVSTKRRETALLFPALELIRWNIAEDKKPAWHPHRSLDEL